MSWTAGDSEALFRRQPDVPGDEEQPFVFDDSSEAMRRLRFPFDADPADVLEQQPACRSTRTNTAAS